MDKMTDPFQWTSVSDSLDPDILKYSPTLQIIVAIDFGTTFSGIAWASTNEPDTLNVVNHWGFGTRTANKAPTILYYDNHGSTGSFKWGFQAQKEARKGNKVHEWFKLGLSPEFERRRAAASGLNNKYPSWTPLPPPQNERLVVDYLKSIKEHVDDQLAAVDTQIIAHIPRKYIITVPAIWDHKEQDRTRNCAEIAGLGKGDQLHVIAEPEAAAIWALSRMPKLKLEVDDTFIVCDAGGGTVDLASFTIESLEPEIKLAGAAKGSGELCGSSYLNRAFTEYLQARMKDYRGGWDQQYLKVAQDTFESEIKLEFTGDDDHSILMPSLTDSQHFGVKDRSLVLEGQKLKEHVFDEVIGKIQQLVENQIANTSKPVKRVLLAGGFGQSTYLKKQLERLTSIQRQGISVEHIDCSETAIVRGALLAGLTQHAPATQGGIRVPRPQVVSRIASKSWGTLAFEEILYESDDKRAKMQPGGERLVECMQWFIEEDSSILDLEQKTFNFHKEQIVYAGRIKEVTVDIYEFSKTLTDNSSTPPRYPDEPGVKKCLSLTMDLSKMNVPIEMHNGQLLYVAKFEILVMLESASLSFSGRYDGNDFPAKRLTFN